MTNWTIIQIFHLAVPSSIRGPWRSARKTSRVLFRRRILAGSEAPEHYSDTASCAAALFRQIPCARNFLGVRAVDIAAEFTVAEVRLDKQAGTLRVGDAGERAVLLDLTSTLSRIKRSTLQVELE